MTDNQSGCNGCSARSEGCASACGGTNNSNRQPDNQIKQTILVMSGKGGVGKSSMAVNLAAWLSRQGQQVGLMDIDLHGPSVPKLLGLEGQTLLQTEGIALPCPYSSNLGVVSIGFLLEDRNTPVIWRGPVKHGMLDQFVNKVQWGHLDTLVVDCPPGTGDEVLSIAQLFGSVDGALIVTTPQEVAMLDVRKCISFCRQLKTPILGLIENMSGLVCPNCSHQINVFSQGAVEEAAAELDVRLLGAVPMTPDLAGAGDSGQPLILSQPTHPAAQAMAHCFAAALEKTNEQPSIQIGSEPMKLALPVNDRKLSAHFGHCQQFAIVSVDAEKKVILDTELLTPPAHEPGVLPRWLGEMGVSRVIAGGMGQRAQELLAEKNIEVIIGAPVDEPQQLIRMYLDGRLVCGENVCDH